MITCLIKLSSQSCLYSEWRVFLKVLENKYLEIYKFEGLAFINFYLLFQAVWWPSVKCNEWQKSVSLKILSEINCLPALPITQPMPSKLELNYSLYIWLGYFIWITWTFIKELSDSSSCFNCRVNGYFASNKRDLQK